MAATVEIVDDTDAAIDHIHRCGAAAKASGAAPAFA